MAKPTRSSLQSAAGKPRCGPSNLLNPRKMAKMVKMAKNNSSNHPSSSYPRSLLTSVNKPESKSRKARSSTQTIPASTVESTKQWMLSSSGTRLRLKSALQNRRPRTIWCQKLPIKCLALQSMAQSITYTWSISFLTTLKTKSKVVGKEEFK